jgi:hypothetical protein
MRTYSRFETDLAFQWVDKFFKLVELIFEISDDENENDNYPMPTYESELRFQELRLWFFAHQPKFMPIWSELWHNKIPKRYFKDFAEGQEYFENPFLMLYKPNDLNQLAYCLGINENYNAWEPTENGVDMIEDISIDFSLVVLQFIHYVGEFSQDDNIDIIAG